MTEQFTTTLVGEIGVNDSQIQVGSAGGINNPGSLNAFNATPTYIQIDNEWMAVDNNYEVGSDLVPVVRGVNSTDAAPHAAGASVMITTLDNVQL